jgi:hypothetical protein
MAPTGLRLKLQVRGICRVRDMGGVTRDVSSQIATPG